MNITSAIDITTLIGNTEKLYYNRSEDRMRNEI